MKVKDLIEFLQTLDPEMLVNVAAGADEYGYYELTRSMIDVTNELYLGD